MDKCPYCGRKVSGLELSARTRTARYHEDCRYRELGLPPEPWMPIRIALAVRDLLALLMDSPKALGNPSEYKSERSPRERSDEIGMKHGDPWL